MAKEEKKKSWWDKLWEDKLIALSIILGLLALVAIIFPWNTLHNFHIPFTDFYLKTDDYGPLGDFISGISNPMLGVATIILLLRTYSLQKTELNKTTELLMKQRFEDNFFRMLDNHHRIIEAMDIYTTEDGINEEGKEDATMLSSKKKKKKRIFVSAKRDCFRTFYNHIKNQFDDKELESFTTGFLAGNDKKVMDAYHITQEKYLSDLHHYFRFVYHMLKFVKSETILDDDEKYKYASILRATLSPYEIALLYYNGLHKNGIKMFHPLLEEYSFLKNIHKPLLFIPHRREIDYHPLTFATSEDRPKYIDDWKVAILRKKEAENARKREDEKKYKEALDKAETIQVP